MDKMHIVNKPERDSLTTVCSAVRLTGMCLSLFDCSTVFYFRKLGLSIQFNDLC